MFLKFYKSLFILAKLLTLLGSKILNAFKIIIYWNVRYKQKLSNSALVLTHSVQNWAKCYFTLKCVCVYVEGGKGREKEQGRKLIQKKEYALLVSFSMALMELVGSSIMALIF